MRITKLVAIIATLALFAVWGVLFRPTFLGGPAGYVIVSGKSMEPTLYAGDLVITKQQPSYEVGDIVAFRVEGGMVIHRIIGGDAENGYVIQGDNKPTPDLWRPTPAEILGRQWIAIPNAGTWFQQAGEPLPLGVFLGVLGVGAVTGEKTARRRRNGRWKKMQNPNSRGTYRHNDPRLLVGFGVLASVAMLALAVWFIALRTQPTTTTNTETSRYEHRATFDYVALVPPSSLYPSGQLSAGDLVRPAAEDGEPSSAAIFSAQPPSFELQFRYDLLEGDVVNLTGELTPEIIIRAGDAGWKKTVIAGEPLPFQGPGVAHQELIDLAPILAAIAEIETETGYTASEYQVDTVMHVRLAGMIDSALVDESLAYPFTLRVAEGHVTPDARLERTEPRVSMTPVTTGNRVELGPVALPVMATRISSAAVVAFAGVAAGALGAVLFLGLGRAEAARIRARYGSLLVTVVEPGLPETCQEIRLASIADLAKLAQKDGRMVLHQQLAGGEDLYFVQDGQVVYTYRSQLSRPGSLRLAEEEA